MNKQEQIEKMAIEMSVKKSLCREYDCAHCPYVSQFCGRKEVTKEEYDAQDEE